MLRRVLMSMGFALGGLMLLSVGVVAPDGLGRPGPALAEVVHDGTDTTGFVHLAVDCDRVTPGTQSHCVTLGGEVDVDLTVATSEAFPRNFCCFWLDATTDETILDPTEAAYFSPNVGGNPDANEALLSGWQCDPVAPSPDVDPDPNVARSSIHCGTGSQFLTTSDPAHVTLATVHYMAMGSGVAQIELTRGQLADELGGSFKCTPQFPSDTLILCVGATIEVVALGGDYDGDGVTNGVDNCLTVSNTSQMNTDRNFISNAPNYTVHDITRVNSDDDGDECDADDDNDGVLDAAEAAGCNGSGPLADLNADTDGDRFLDGAECARGTDPASATNVPTLASCGTTADADGDRLQDRQERCLMNTDPSIQDTDGDGVRDGCEAASINADSVVNSGDQLLFQMEYTRVLLGGPMPLVNLDINKDGNFNSGDKLALAFLITPSGQCP